jgi:long-chain acyl-CoA synthetase
MILTGIQKTAAFFPEKIAIQMRTGDRYQQYTYRDIIRAAASVARSLTEQGINKGDRVAVLSENRPEWMLAYFAVVSFGAVVVPLDAQLSENEVAVLLASSEAKGVFV